MGAPARRWEDMSGRTERMLRDTARKMDRDRAAGVTIPGQRPEIESDALLDRIVRNMEARRNRLRERRTIYGHDQY